MDRTITEFSFFFGESLTSFFFALTWPGDSDYEFSEKFQNDLVQRCHFIEGACQVVRFGWHYTFKDAFLNVFAEMQCH